MNEWQRKGYDAWIALWVLYGHSPSASMCPARYMPNGSDRTDFLRGWIKARDENNT